MNRRTLISAVLGTGALATTSHASKEDEYTGFGAHDEPRIDAGAIGSLEAVSENLRILRKLENDMTEMMMKLNRIHSQVW